MHSKILDYISWDNHQNWVIRLEYSPYAINQAKLISKNGILDEAIERKYEEAISIDGIESLDLDDAIWAEKTKKWYSIFVHISDVTEAVKIYSPLDLEALKRTTSIYRKEGVINMYPDILSQDILSLNEDWEKLTLTMQIDLDENCYIKDFRVYESILKNKKRYDYLWFIDDYLNPESEFHKDLHLMYEIARKRKNIRKIEWASMDYDESDRQLFIWEKPKKSTSKNKAIPTSIIEEFMILANITSAIISVKNNYNSIFRLHQNYDEKAYYHNVVWNHKWLALSNYTHFTSPIRRYADNIVHRVLKIVHIRWEDYPYTSWEIADISYYINFSRTIIDILWKDAEEELKSKKIITRLKQKKQQKLNTSDFTSHIRNHISNGRKIPKILVEEIIEDLQNWEKSNWAWAIWVLLVSGDESIKIHLKKALLDDRKFKAKAIISMLNTSKILSIDEHSLFDINETQVWNKYSIEVKFRWEKIFSNSINFWKFSPPKAIWKLRSKIIKKIVEYFCGK